MWRSMLSVICGIAVTDCARILAVFPTPSVSHQVVFRHLTQELVKRGHEVVVLTTDPAFPKGQAPENLTEIDLHELSYTIWKSFHATSTGKKTDLLTQMEVALNLLKDIFMKQLETNEVQKIIKSKESFDLIFVEACVRPALVFSHLHRAPTIQISSFGGFLGSYEIIGAPNHPLLFPLSTRQRIYNLTIWEKISELYNYYVFDRLFISLETKENEAIWSVFGPDVPPLSELQKNVQMLFLNVYPLWDGNRPVPPSVVYMGGIHRKPNKELPQELESYLNSSKHGVIYVSFGTNVSPSLLPPHKIQAVVDAFSVLPYDVLWKWDADELPGRTKNIRISKWLPQSDMLRHPKIKLFITQAGLQSIDEAVLAGVPLVSIPMLGDQWFNAEKLVQLGMGLKLDMETLTSDSLMEAMETVINDGSYRRNVAKFRSLMYDQPQSPLDRVIWWTEHVLRHGTASHLRAPTANISWAEFLELEVIIVLLATVLAMVALAGLVLYYFYIYVLSSMSFGVRKIKQN